MNKQILLSIKPKYVDLMKKGLKTLELRLSIPDDFKGLVNLYETLGEVKYVKSDDTWGSRYPEYYDQGLVEGRGRKITEGRGQVVARFWFDDSNIYEMKINDVNIPYYAVSNKTLSKLCLTYNEFLTYANGNKVYTWNINDLEIFDEPKSITDFITKKPFKNVNGRVIGELRAVVTKAPMSWFYVYERK